MRISALPRKVRGTGVSRRLRIAGKVPAIIYGARIEPVMIELDHNDLYHALRKESFHSSILSLDLEGKTQKVLLRDFQMHPFRSLVLHADFQRIDPKQKIHIKVPLHFMNAEISDAVKLSGGIVSHILNELDIVCLPAHLPEFIEVDLSQLTANQSIHVNQVILPKGVSLVSTVEQENPVVVTVVMPAVAAVEETQEVIAADKTA